MGDAGTGRERLVRLDRNGVVAGASNSLFGFVFHK